MSGWVEGGDLLDISDILLTPPPESDSSTVLASCFPMSTSLSKLTIMRKKGGAPKLKCLPYYKVTGIDVDLRSASQ